MPNVATAHWPHYADKSVVQFCISNRMLETKIKEFNYASRGAPLNSMLRTNSSLRTKSATNARPWYPAPAGNPAHLRPPTFVRPTAPPELPTVSTPSPNSYEQRPPTPLLRRHLIPLLPTENVLCRTRTLLRSACTIAPISITPTFPTSQLPNYPTSEL